MKAYKTVGILAALALTMLLARGQQSPQAEASSPAGPVQGAAPVPANLSPNVTEVVRLAESGVGEDVLLAYVHNTQSPFGLGAPDILYLKDVGLTSPVITAMLNRDNELRGQTQPPSAPPYEQKLYASGTQAPAPQVAPAPAPVEAGAPAPTLGAATAPPPVYVSNPPADVAYFYNDLSPYGTWIELEGVGWCWQPRAVVMNRAWRPYCDSGYWMNSDAGWYWHSDYSWGWAPFHYGRWQLHARCGWVWMPDRVWGPAWVTWRSAGANCGWAPLPPHATFDVHLGYCFNGVQVGLNFDFGLHADHYTFIPLSDFHHHDYGHYRLPPTQVRNFYNNTTVINNYVVNNNVVVNRGLPVERVSAATHTQFQKAAIRDLPAGRGGAQVAQAPARGVIYRPQLTAPAKPVNMVAQRVDPRNPVVQHATLVPPTGQQRPARLGAPVTGPVPAQVRPTTPSTVTRPANQGTVSPAQNPKTPSYANPAPVTSSRSTQETKNNSGPATSAASPAPERHAPSSYNSSTATRQPPQSTAGSQVQQNPHFYQPKTYYQTPKGRAPVSRQPSGSTSKDNPSTSEPKKTP